MKVLLEVGCWLILLAMMMCVATAHADPIKVAVIDTGLDLTDRRFEGHLCSTGHIDFTGEGLQDDLGHGTHVAGLIVQYAKDSNYCLVILKYYGKKDEQRGLGYSGYALKEAVNQHYNIINLSLSGQYPDQLEKKLICEHKDIEFIVASGNKGLDLDKTPSYPASYGCSNMRIVGGLRQGSSNYGSVVTDWEEGSNVKSTLPDGQWGRMTGTSMACAIHTGKYVYEITNKSP